MTPTLGDLKRWMEADENEHLEFKEAKQQYHFETLVKYCAALANEGGGRIIFGVTDKKPRRVVGSQAFANLERTKAGLTQRLHLRVDADVLQHPDGRIVVFAAPAHPIGMPIQYKGAYWMRGGEDLLPMTPDMLKRIFAEGEPDFSAGICSNASINDIDPEAVAKLRGMWRRHSGNQALESLPMVQLLEDAELLIDESVTYAALILLGTRGALGKHLAQSEVIFEYRSRESSLSYQQRVEFREGFFLFHDDLWGAINLRNDLFHYQDGLFMRDIPTFNEMVVREAILNAISHRDYRLAGSVFVRQFPNKLEIVSPGGFPPGISPKTILQRQSPRNRRVAEVLAKCGLVERSGQGARRMFEECIKESKPYPDFTGSDDYQVFLTLRGDVQDPRFLRYLERIGQETLDSFTTFDLLLLDHIHKERSIPNELRGGLPLLLDRGIVERIGRGRYVLSRRFYRFVGKDGVYTRKRGLDRETNKALLLKHIRDNWKHGSRLRELTEVLPSLTHNQVKKLLQGMKSEGRICITGRTKGARWFPVSEGEIFVK